MTHTSTLTKPTVPINVATAGFAEMSYEYNTHTEKWKAHIIPPDGFVKKTQASKTKKEYGRFRSSGSERWLGAAQENSRLLPRRALCMRPVLSCFSSCFCLPHFFVIRSLCYAHPLLTLMCVVGARGGVQRRLGEGQRWRPQGPTAADF